MRNKRGTYYQFYRNKKNYKGILSKRLCQLDKWTKPNLTQEEKREQTCKNKFSN